MLTDLQTEKKNLFYSQKTQQTLINLNKTASVENAQSQQPLRTAFMRTGYRTAIFVTGVVQSVQRVFIVDGSSADLQKN
jgi:hypothetical protein